METNNQNSNISSNILPIFKRLDIFNAERIFLKHPFIQILGVFDNEKWRNKKCIANFGTPFILCDNMLFQYFPDTISKVSANWFRILNQS